MKPSKHIIQPLDPVDYYQAATSARLSYHAQRLPAGAVIVVRRGAEPLGWLCACRLADCGTILQGGLLELAHRTDILCSTFAARRDLMIAAAGDLTQAKALLTLMERTIAHDHSRAALREAHAAAVRTRQRLN